MNWIISVIVCLAVASFAHGTPCSCTVANNVYVPNTAKDCTTYYHMSAVDNVVFEKDCSPGLIFDATVCTCNWPRDTTCPADCPVPGAATAAPAQCPSGYIRGPTDRCYQFAVEPKLSWAEARNSCLSRDAVMATPRTSDEIEFIRAYRFEHGLSERFWLGGLRQNGRWVWTDGLPFTAIEVFGWAEGQPSLGSNELCLDVLENSGTNINPNTPRWNDANCELEKEGVICERSLI